MLWFLLTRDGGSDVQFFAGRHGLPSWEAWFFAGLSRGSAARHTEAAEGKLQILKQDLEEMNTMLGNLSKVQAPNTMAKLWMNEVRDLSYDIEDYIDKTMSPSNTGEKNQEIPFEIEEFVTLVKHARDRYSRYDLGRWASSPAMPMVADGQVRLPTLSGQAITDLVGINDATTKLIKLLSNDAEQGMKVVSVLGPAGVGKSTLAKQVYRQMGGKFDCRAFVRASRMPDTRRLLRSIISHVQRHQRPPHGLPVQELIGSLREHLQKKGTISQALSLLVNKGTLLEKNL